MLFQCQGSKSWIRHGTRKQIILLYSTLNHDRMRDIKTKLLSCNKLFMNISCIMRIITSIRILCFVYVSWDMILSSWVMKQWRLWYSIKRKPYCTLPSFPKTHRYNTQSLENNLTLQKTNKQITDQQITEAINIYDSKCYQQEMKILKTLILFIKISSWWCLYDSQYVIEFKKLLSTTK